MRTVILVGLLAIASAINENWVSSNTAWIFAALIVIVSVMDFTDFIFKER